MIKCVIGFFYIIPHYFLIEILAICKEFCTLRDKRLIYISTKLNYASTKLNFTVAKYNFIFSQFTFISD